LDEVRALCERCTVLRAGRVAGVVDARRETNDGLAALMLGAAPPAAAARTARAGDVALEVRGVSLAGAQPQIDGPALAPVELTVRAGEVVGIAGISGNGQGALLDALSGEVRTGAGTVRLFGRDVSGEGVRRRRAAGLRTIPEERMGRGAVPGLSLAANTALTRDELVTRGWLRRGRARDLAAALIERFGVKAEGPDATAGSLSGGNLQKLIVGREIDAGPRVLLVAQPTWGLDVGAAARIRRELTALADAGCAVLVISEDLEELFEISDRLMVMAKGRLSPAVPVGEATIGQIGAWMGGVGL
ncbi:MAG TPA: ATP-binding cassette domain-containing protein, partial [Kofleriaceae bacterium]|nr:ATP-binding cassette domain-containing protein [Kofleriaceae bacterium]